MAAMVRRGRPVKLAVSAIDEVLCRRRVDPSSLDSPWRYAPDVAAAVTAWQFLGFPAVEFDNFLAEPGWDDSATTKEHRAELIKWRAGALEAWRAGDVAQTKTILTLMKADMDRTRERKAVLPLARLGKRHSAAQTIRAKAPRAMRGDSGQSVMAALQRLSSRQESAKELWPEAFGILDKLGLDPEDVTSDAQPTKWVYEYGPQNDRRTLAFGTFQGYLTNARKNNKSR